MFRLSTVTLSLLPAACGCIAAFTCVAFAKLLPVIALSAMYLMSYIVAVPLLASSPTAIQFNVTLVCVGLLVANVFIVAGAMVSCTGGIAAVFPLTTLDNTLVLGT